MPNSKNGDATKHALSDSLKNIMASKPLEKISIRELVEDCDLNRQTFYYHFEDIYDLLRWMFQQEALSLVEKHEGIMIWQDGLFHLFQYLEENKAMCLCALHSLGHEHLKRFFYADINSIVVKAMDHFSEEMNIPKSQHTTFISHMFTITFAALMESWLLDEMDYTPKELINEVDIMLRNQIKGAQENQ